MSLLEDLSTLYSAVVADILDGRGYTQQTLPISIHALTPAQRVSGRVYTVKTEAVDAVPESPYKLEMEAIDTAQKGDVLVMDGEYDTGCAVWGELLSTACMARGVNGIVMTACSRDLWALRSMDFPVFGIGTFPADSKGRRDVVAIREPLELGGVKVEQGDYLLGDVDGVVIIPQGIAAEIIAEAKEKVSGENTVRDELAAGVPVAEVFRRHGIL